MTKQNKGRRRPEKKGGLRTVRVRSPRIVRPGRDARGAKAKPILVTDLDGTLIREQLLVLLTKEFFEYGIFRKIVERLFKEVRLQHRDRKMTFEEYDRKLIDIYSKNVKGKQREHVQHAAQIVHDKHRDWLYQFTKALLEECRTTHECITITGALKETVSLMAAHWGLETYYCTELSVDENGRYTGEYDSLPVRDKGAKLLAHVAERGGSLVDSVAIGDTMSDAPLLRAVEIPIAFNPDDLLKDLAKQNGWPIVIERKDCIYVLQGDTFVDFNAADAALAVQYVLTLRPRVAPVDLSDADDEAGESDD